jgi:hypothetical protein
LAKGYIGPAADAEEENMSEDDQGSNDVAKAPKERSPSFPFISLPVAVQRLEQFEAYFGRHPARAVQAGLAWGMKGFSSQAQQTLAALKAFGFVDYEGAGESRQARITDLGRTYLRAQQDSIKADALKKAALQPKAIVTFFASWGSDRPKDPVCLDELVLKHRYTEQAARLFLKVYDETIAFAGLADSDKSAAGDQPEADKSHKDGAKVEHPETPPKSFKPGDLVQREVSGNLTFPAPRKVASVFNDAAHGWMVSVEGYHGAFPMSEIIAATAVKAAPIVQPIPAQQAEGDAPTKDPIETFLANGRLQINANVGLEGIARLKQMLDKYEELLKLMN